MYILNFSLSFYEQPKKGHDTHIQGIARWKIETLNK